MNESLEDGDTPLKLGQARRAAFLGASIATLLLLGVAAATGGLSLWLALAAPVGVAAALALVRSGTRTRSAPGRVATVKRLAAAQTLLASIPDPVILVNRRAVVLEANAAAVSLLPALKAQRPLSFALRAPEVLGGIEEVIKTGEPTKVEYSERVPTERVFEVQIGQLQNVRGGPDGEVGVVLFFRDLTSARRLEGMRVDFIANVSHELRTPLASLLGFIETLQGPARNDPAARERFLEIMREQARRMSRLIDDLLSLSRIELRAHLAPQTPLDLRSAAAEMIDTLGPLARSHGVEIVTLFDEGPYLVLGDRDEILRVVENLVENAVKYGGDRVEVRAWREIREDGRAVLHLRVSDNGPGIAPEHLPRLTERFYRVDAASSRQKGGTGLGLAIVKHIVARHRGRLLIESRPGEGASFTMELPALAADDRTGT